MPDWPSTSFGLGPPSGTIMMYSSRCGVIAQTNSASAVWPATNRALFQPFWLDAQITVYQMALVVSTQSGNLDVGIYSEAGVRLVSAGSTAVAAAGVQRVNIADTTLDPGGYYMAMSVDNTTASFTRNASDALAMEALGVRQQALGSVALVDPATFAAPAAGYIPALALSLNPTI